MGSLTKLRIVPTGSSFTQTSSRSVWSTQTGCAHQGSRLAMGFHIPFHQRAFNWTEPRICWVPGTCSPTKWQAFPRWCEAPRDKATRECISKGVEMLSRPLEPLPPRLHFGSCLRRRRRARRHTALGHLLAQTQGWIPSKD